MNRFLYKSIFISCIIATTLYILSFFANGYTDPFYTKLSNGKSGSLIIGSSRVAQAIIPHVIDSAFEANNLLPPHLLNFGFTNSHSPIGPIYYNIIKNKVDTTKKDNIYIISISPWAVGTYCNSPEDSSNFRESFLELAKISDVSSNPNFDYLINAYGYGWGSFLIKNFENFIQAKSIDYGINLDGKWGYVHNDGWFEIKTSGNEVTPSKQIVNKEISDFKKESLQKKYKISNTRLQYLDKIITYLNTYGTVYLVRLPVHNSIISFENELFPNFNTLIVQIAKKKSIEYINYTKTENQYNYSDGNHLTVESSKLFSEKISTLLINNKK